MFTMISVVEIAIPSFCKNPVVGTTCVIVPLELRKSGELNIRKIDDFFTQIAKLQVEAEIIKTDSNSFQILKDLNGKLSLLKTIRSFIGNPLIKEPESNSGGSNEKNQESKPYLSLPNKSIQFDTSPIKDDELKKNLNYLSIRDYIVFNSVNRLSFKSYISTLNSIISKYQEYINSGDRVLNKPNNSLSNAKNLDQKKTEIVNQGGSTSSNPAKGFQTLGPTSLTAARCITASKL